MNAKSLAQAFTLSNTKAPSTGYRTKSVAILVPKIGK